jgi:hypothetical protein
MPPKKKDDGGNASAKKDEYRDIEKDTELKNEYDLLESVAENSSKILFLLILRLDKVTRELEDAKRRVQSL